METFRINKNHDFTVMSNIHLRDKNLSLKAKGLLSFMLSLPEDWDYSYNGLVAICKEGIDAIRATIKELQLNYYLEIKKMRNEKGIYEYEYIIYENPFENPLKMRNSPDMGFPHMDEPDMDNPIQINTNNKIDNIDKIDNKNNRQETTQEIKHNILTLELIHLNYINEDDASSFYYDNLFKKYISNGYNYKELCSAVHYIVSKVKERNFKDEDGKKIENRYGYFKNSIEYNLKKFETVAEELYSENDLKDFYSDIEGR